MLRPSHTSLLLLLLTASVSGLYRWENDEVEVIRTARPRLGHPLVLAVRHRAEYSRTNCTLRPPLQPDLLYQVEGDRVMDQTGSLVHGVQAWDDGGDGSVCGIKILEMQDYHGEEEDLNSEAWKILMTFSQGGIHGQEMLDKIEVGVHLRDENILRPQLQDWFGLQPLHYQLSIVPDLLMNNQTISFTGVADIEMLVTTWPGFIIGLNMFAIDIRKLGGVAKRKNGSQEEMFYTMIHYNLQEDTVILFAGNSLLEPGDVVIPHIEYEARVNFNVMSGYGVWRQPCDGSQDPAAKQCWFTMFAATGARQLLPCLDEPSSKAVFDVRIARTEGWRTLFNTPVNYTEPLPDHPGWVWDVFTSTPRMSTYTMALAIQDYQSVTASDRMKVWAPRNYIEAGFADYAALVGPQCVSATEKLYGVNYTLDKMDMVQVNNYGTAMENWGLILYQFEWLLYDSSKPDPEDDRKYDVLETVAHELAHQWFGNLVTLDWWDEMWLNEGFATYVSHVVADIVDPAIHSWDRFVAYKLFHVMKIDSRPSSWALSGPVTSTWDIDRKFGDISYYKGGAIVRMMESFLGVETLNKGLHRYLLDLSYQNSVEEDLFLHLEAAGLEDGVWPQAGVEDLTSVMKSWTQQAGLPLVTVTRRSEEMLEISQSWYRNSDTSSTEQTWTIPLTMTDLSSLSPDWDQTSPDLWLEDTRTEVKVDPGYIPLMNKKAVGYYRVNYDTETWREISSVLMTDHERIHPFNRAQIICDVSHLAAHGAMEQETADLVLEYFTKENHFAPVRAHSYCVHNKETGGGKKLKRNFDS